jgi:hypothetical protein
LAAEGEKALREWLAEPTAELTELRDLALLKVFFGANPAAMAAEQVKAHSGKLAEYEAIMEKAGADLPRGVLLSLEAGILSERTWIRFWSRQAE